MMETMEFIPKSQQVEDALLNGVDGFFGTAIKALTFNPELNLIPRQNAASLVVASEVLVDTDSIEEDFLHAQILAPAIGGMTMRQEAQAALEGSYGNEQFVVTA